MDRSATLTLLVGRGARSGQCAWLDRLEAELGNVRLALGHFEASGEHPLVLRLCAAFWWIWSLRGPLMEGLDRIARALEHDPSPTIARANALIGASDLAGDAGDAVASRAWGEEALGLHRALGNDWGVAYVQYGLGVLFAEEDRFSEAKALLEQSVRGFHELGDEHWEMQVNPRLAWAYESLGDVPRAREINLENLRRARERGETFIEAKSLAVLAQYDLDEGRVETAIPLLAEAHRIERGRKGIVNRYWTLILFARALALKGEAVATLRLLSCADAGFDELEIGEGNAERWIVRMNHETRELVGSSIDDEEAAAAREDGRKLTVDQAVTLALHVLRSS